MTSNSRPIWERAPDDLFPTYFNKLNPWQQWIVNQQLDAMTYKKDPARYYHHEICTDCGLRLHLFGIRDGLGNDVLEIEVYLDYERRIMYPLDVYPV